MANERFHPVDEEHGWIAAEGFICKDRTCGGQAMMNPKKPQQWGCRKCQLICWSPSVFFISREELEHRLHPHGRAAQ
ncbi:MAG: hypothetical protein COU09_00075 [Candidatus Harrisonbacteria bacterium CG10_big_fil_rev_8_21_14_0_10_44_23]|uniref:Uncharacterized protein n=1 Tax=Candidatus Harrisonbacteria bacterium CG10_big_fil_rev_8_21_14_0_10_44_23 TaxID=1974585 RepID=A0A2H0UR06_9BACT|nr:MAG: hypothetical protein COU09_00075 [Candidatus Harrisonbacteria bacterium CG10_big_fil_rev_8_21_14_0_10_44_23]